MLKITIHDSAKECRFRLEGRLCGPWVPELEMCWQTAASTTSDRKTIVDLRDVDFVDDPGRELIQRMHRAAVRFVAATPVMRDLVEEVTGAPAARPATASKSKQPGLTKLVSRSCLALLILASTSKAFGADSSSARAALDRYLAGTPAAGSDVATRVQIQASLPKMGRSGVMQVLEFIPRQGRTLFRVLGFEGDGLVKRQVIARYLSAEASAHEDVGALALSAANYKFQLTGSADYLGRAAWVWRVEPRSRRAGLYSGELWLDAATARPLRQWGVLAKSPSVFIRQVYFVRDFDINTGSVRRLIVNSNTRIAGAVDLTLWYQPVAEGPEALTAFRCDTERKPGTPVAQISDVSLHNDSGLDACTL